MSYQDRGVAPYAAAAVALLQGPIYTEDRVWQLMLDYEMELRNHFVKMGLELQCDREEGYAFLRQMEPEEGDEGSLPRLVRRIPLSFELTMLLVLLREWLDEFETQEDRSSELRVTGKAIRERIGLFLEKDARHSRLSRNLDKYLRQAREMGYLVLVEGGEDLEQARFTVKRILKAKIGVDELQEIKARLITYTQLSPSTGNNTQDDPQSG